MDLSVLNAIDLSAPGFLIMVIGPPDSGKSTLAQLIYHQLCMEYSQVAYLDGDPGQSTLGPPTTLSLAINRRGDRSFPPQGRMWRHFIGSTSPRGHMLPMLVGVHRLVQKARENGIQVVVYDTCGLVNAREGGLALKLAEIELLQPSMLIALQREKELETLLEAIKAYPCRVVRCSPSSQVRPRSAEERRNYRARRFKEYFHQADVLTLDRSTLPLAVIAPSSLQPSQIISLEDAQGFVLALGILQETNEGQFHILTPLKKVEACRILRAGSLLLDSHTFQEKRVMLE